MQDDEKQRDAKEPIEVSADAHQNLEALVRAIGGPGALAKTGIATKAAFYYWRSGSHMISAETAVDLLRWFKANINPHCPMDLYDLRPDLRV
mgnify:CR=1 FL=1